LTGQTAWSQGSGVAINDNAGAGDLYTTLSADRIISLVVAASYGIRYSVALIDDLLGLSEMQALDLAVVSENRWVYRYDGIIWEMFFQLDAAHNHDTLYATINHNHDSSYAAIGHSHYSISPQIIPVNTDLNNYTTPGLYYCPANATVATLLNCPTSNAFSLRVEKHAGYNQTLTEYTTSAHKIYTRNNYNGTWGSWGRIWNSERDGSGSGLDADKLDGYHASTSPAANYIALRDSAGDIQARLVRSTYVITNSTPLTSVGIVFRVNNSSDNYHRTMSKTAFSNWCQVAQISTYNSFRLGGVAAASYLRSDTSDTFTGILTVVGGIYINNSNTRILEGSTNSLRIQTNGYTTDIGCRNSSWCHYETSGTSGHYFYEALTAPDYNLTSDIRFKKKIKKYKNGLERVLALKPCTFDWNGKKKIQGKTRTGNDLGFIAQWTEEIEPLLVNTDSDGLKSMKYNKITILNTAAIQEFYVKQDDFNTKTDKRLIKLEKHLGLN